MPDPEEHRVRIPGDITLREFLHNIPLSVVWKIGAMIVSSFLFGVAVGERNTLWEFITSGGSSYGSASPNSESAEAGKAEGSVLAIRSENHVVLIDALQNELTSDRINAGQYGYAFAEGIENYVRDRDPLRLRVVGSFLSFEVHKTGDNRLMVIAFVSRLDVAALKDPTGARRDFQVFSVQQEGTVPVAIGLDGIVDWKPRDLPGNTGIIAELRLK